MAKLKDIIITVLTTVAVSLALATFFLYKALTHQRELRDAKTFLESAPHSRKKEILDALDVKRGTFEETAQRLRDEVEKETKNEIINRFKKAFGVADDLSSDDAIDDRNATGTDERR